MCPCRVTLGMQRGLGTPLNMPFLAIFRPFSPIPVYPDRLVYRAYRYPISMYMYITCILYIMVYTYDIY